MIRTLNSYKGMKQRCYNPKAPDYARYGGRGIKVCERWLNSYQAFVDDMGERPLGKTLERVDASGNYEPDNCCWATQYEQAHNRTSTVRVTYQGRTQSLTQWGQELNLGREMLYKRYAKWGNNPEKLFAKTGTLRTGSQDRRKSQQANLITYQGETKTVMEWCEELGLNYRTVYSRTYNNNFVTADEILFGRG